MGDTIRLSEPGAFVVVSAKEGERQPMDSYVFTRLIKKPDGLNGRLQSLHLSLLERFPDLDRIACVLYDQSSDTLRTFINSTRSGHSIDAYEFKLSASPSLSALAQSGQSRLIDHISDSIKPDSPHSDWLLQQHYHSSLTLPMLHNGDLLGFIFFDASANMFTRPVRQELELHADAITMAVASEMNSVQLLLATVKVAIDFARLRDFETGLHLDRMAHFSRLIAKYVAGPYALEDDFVEHVYLYAPLHDIGKVGVPDSILLKPGKLDEHERSIMETHVDKGVEILEKLIADHHLADAVDAEVMRNIVAYHHELLDGSGYPNHLAGECIPVEARIVTVADIFDALTCMRPYKQAWSVDDALQELQQMADNGKLDRLCVQALTGHADEALRIVRDFSD